VGGFTIANYESFLVKNVFERKNKKHGHRVVYRYAIQVKYCFIIYWDESVLDHELGHQGIANKTADDLNAEAEDHVDEKQNITEAKNAPKNTPETDPGFEQRARDEKTNRDEQYDSAEYGDNKDMEAKERHELYQKIGAAGHGKDKDKQGSQVCGFVLSAPVSWPRGDSCHLDGKHGERCAGRRHACVVEPQQLAHDSCDAAVASRTRVLPRERFTRTATLLSGVLRRRLGDRPVLPSRAVSAN
jgi:hypothetical protein